MYNVLIADDNIEYIKNITNTILSKNANIRLFKIANKEEEVIKCIEDGNIDIILINVSMSSGTEILECLNKKELVNKTEIIKISEKEIFSNKIIEYIDNFIENGNKRFINTYFNEKLNTVKRFIAEELKKLNYNFKYNGTKYIFESIIYICEEGNKYLLLDNLEKNVYSIIASRHDKTVDNIKNNIVKATNNMYMDCNLNYLLYYFKYSTDTKPTPKVVISTIVNKLLEDE